MACLALVGCGGAGAQNTPREQTREEIFAYTEPSPEFSRVVEKLAEAAEAEQTYMAARKARDFAPVEEATVHWFCYTAWQLVVNDELDLLPDREYMINRLTVRVILGLSGVYSPQGQALYRRPISIAVDEVDRIVDLASFGPKQSRRYKRACYGGPR